MIGCGRVGLPRARRIAVEVTRGREPLKAVEEHELAPRAVAEGLGQRRDHPAAPHAALDDRAGQTRNLPRDEQVVDELVRRDHRASGVLGKEPVLGPVLESTSRPNGPVAQAHRHCPRFGRWSMIRRSRRCTTGMVAHSVVLRCPLRPRRAGGPTRRSRPGRHGSAFVGRHDPLAVLADELARVAAGEPRIVWVVGESGIGKTALVQRGLDPAPNRVVWVSGEETETALAWGLVDQARAALGLERGIAAGEHADPFEVGAELLTDLSSVDGPTAVVVDDLQWADPPSAAALLFALRRVQVEPVLFVLVTRPDPAQSLGDSWARLLADTRQGATITLDGLDVDDIVELSIATGAGSLDPGAAQRLRDHTRG